MQAIHTAASGMESQQTRLDTIANNIANSSTVGYKTTRVDFKDAMYTLMDSPVVDSEEGNLLKGSGVLLSATKTEFSNGAPTETGKLLDFSIQGKGFFTVENADGGKYYTRNGEFGVSSEDGNAYLVTSQGYYVLDADGNRIQLPGDYASLGVSSDGVLNTDSGNFATLGIAEFPNPDGLSAVGSTCYQATAASGEPSAATDSTVTQGSLESSNVNLVDEMTLLMRAQRTFSMASTALRTADQMDGLANNMH